MANFIGAYNKNKAANLEYYGNPHVDRLLQHIPYYNANFYEAQNIVKANEGGYQDLSNDSGNWTGGKIGSGNLIGTKYGISAPVLKAHLGYTPTVNEMKNLSYSTALSIYKNNYWDKLGLDSVKNQTIADLIYDGAVNEGVGGIKSIVSGSLGTSYSPNAINNYKDQQALFNSIKQGRVDKYKEIGTFFTSHLNRLKKFVFSGISEAENIFKAHKWLIVGISIALLGTGLYFIFKD